MLKTFSGRNPSQNEYELKEFVKLLNSRGVKRFLEVGARHGDTGHFIMTNLPKGSTYVGVDLPGGLWGSEKSKPFLERVVSDLKSKGYNAHCMFANSQEVLTRDFVDELSDYDAIMIDGDHSLEGVSRDWLLYGQMAPIIAFHDIVGQDQAEKVHGTPVEVPKLWAKLKQTNKTMEFVDVGSAMGIGCLLR